MRKEKGGLASRIRLAYFDLSRSFQKARLVCCARSAGGRSSRLISMCDVRRETKGARRVASSRRSIERLLVEPRTEDGQRGRVVGAAFPANGPVVAAQRVRRQHDGQLQFNRFLHAVRFDLELQCAQTCE